MSITPLKNDESIRLQWNGVINKNQIRLKKTNDNIVIQIVSQNVFNQIYNKIIRTQFIKKYFGKINTIKPSINSTLVLEKETDNKSKQNLVPQFSRKLYQSVLKIQRQIDNSIKKNTLMAFNPKLRQLESSSNELIKLLQTKANFEDFDLGNQFLTFAKAYNDISLKEANKWNSKDVLTKDDVLNYAAYYPNSPTKSIDQFAQDTTGKEPQELNIIQFATHTLGLDALKLSIHIVTAGLTSGASGEPVYLIQEKNSKKLLCIVKIKSLETATKEINALRLMKKQNMKNCHFPEVMGLGKCGKDTSILFAQSPAKGLSIDKYIELMGKSTKENRRENLKTLLEAVKTMAKGMAEMHNQKSSKIINKVSKLINKNKKVINYVDKFIDEMNELLNEKVFTDMNLVGLKKQIEKTRSFKLKSTIVHGDFHPGNVFYSKEDSFLTLIDNDGVMDSFSETFEPMGIASYDFSYCYQWMIVLSSMNQLSKTEMQSLLGEFEKQYISSRNVGNKDELKQEIEFMKIYVLIKYVSLITAALNDEQHHWFKALGKVKLENLRNLLIEGLKTS